LIVKQSDFPASRKITVRTDLDRVYPRFEIGFLRFSDGHDLDNRRR